MGLLFLLVSTSGRQFPDQTDQPVHRHQIISSHHGPDLLLPPGKKIPSPETIHLAVKVEFLERGKFCVLSRKP